MGVGAEEGKLAPDFLLETLDGGELSLSDLRGQAVALNFWASWCAPCRKEIPQLVAASDQFAEQGLVVVGANLQESPDTIRRYAEDFGMDFPIALDRTGSVADEYRLLGIPTTYFIDRQGVIRSVFRGPFLEQLEGTSVQGAIEESELLKRIREILG
jgi:peroxiredoxin